MVLIAQSRNLNMKEVLAYSLGPLPWELASYDGSMRKTNKAALARELLKQAKVVEAIAPDSAVVLDGMGLVQKISGCLSTFSTVTKSVFAMALNEGRASSRIDVVFDVYKEDSIKAAE